MAHCLQARNYVNLVIGSKQPTPVWLSAEEAAHVSTLSEIDIYPLTSGDTHSTVK